MPPILSERSRLPTPIACEMPDPAEAETCLGVGIADAVTPSLGAALRVATSFSQSPAADHELHSYRPRAAEAYFLQLEARTHLELVALREPALDRRPELVLELAPDVQVGGRAGPAGRSPPAPPPGTNR